MVVVDSKYVARTERLLIRPLKLDDAEDVVLMRKHPEVMKHTPLLSSDDLQKTIEWIQGCHDRDNNWNFAVELLDPSSLPRVIGLIGAVRAPEIGYMFNADYWGKGYATEALRAFTPMFFEHYSGDEGDRYEYAEALTDPELVSSQHVLLKAGFKLHERREKDFEILYWVFEIPWCIGLARKNVLQVGGDSGHATGVLRPEQNERATVAKP